MDRLTIVDHGNLLQDQKPQGQHDQVLLALTRTGEGEHQDSSCVEGLTVHFARMRARQGRSSQSPPLSDVMMLT